GTSGVSYGGNNIISSDGRYVVFYSNAPTLVAGDTNAENDAFMHDRQTGDTIRVSVGPGGAELDHDSFDPVISQDGRYIAYYHTDGLAAYTPGEEGVYIYDTVTTNVEIVTGLAGADLDNDAWEPSISSDGRYVAFNSEASNLVVGDTNPNDDVFIFDRNDGTSVRLSVSNTGEEANSYSQLIVISPDGTHAAFLSDGSNLVEHDYNGAEDHFFVDLTAPAG